MIDFDNLAEVDPAEIIDILEDLSRWIDNGLSIDGNDMIRYTKVRNYIAECITKSRS